MTDLIQRIEQADGPCRELDAEIAAMLCKGRVDVEGRYWKPGVRGFSVSPRFTASIDWALSLVPEGWDWFRWSPGSMVVSKPNPNEKLFALTVEAKGATPALALCLAAIRARENHDGR